MNLALLVIGQLVADLLRLRARTSRAAAQAPSFPTYHRIGCAWGGPAPPRPGLRARARHCQSCPAGLPRPSSSHCMSSGSLGAVHGMSLVIVGIPIRVRFGSRTPATCPFHTDPSRPPWACPPPFCIPTRLLLTSHDPVPARLVGLYLHPRLLPLGFYPPTKPVFRVCQGRPGDDLLRRQQQ